jgi:hypothetical protein
MREGDHVGHGQAGSILKVWRRPVVTIRPATEGIRCRSRFGS